MRTKIEFSAKNLLIGTGVFLIIIGLFTGVFPKTFSAVANMFWLPDKNDHLENQALAQTLRSLMGLYLSVGIFALCGAFVERYLAGALLLCTLCLAGLVSTGLISFIAAGFISVFSIIVFIIELVLLVISIWFMMKTNYGKTTA